MAGTAFLVVLVLGVALWGQRRDTPAEVSPTTHPREEQIL
jgi:uncharacterized iron-regulated membrane protein